MTTNQESIRITILREENRLRQLAAEEATIRARLADLRGQLSLVSDQTDSAHGGPEEQSPTIPVTAPEKVALFGSLFRGRRDIFPRRWENRRTGGGRATHMSPFRAAAWRRPASHFRAP